MADQSSQQDPLAALEDLIKQNKSDDTAKAEQVKEEEALKAQQLEAELKVREAEQQQADATQIQQQLAELQNIGNTSQNQARVQQIQEEQGQRQVELENQQGHEIRQLEHTTVEVEAEENQPAKQG